MLEDVLEGNLFRPEACQEAEAHPTSAPTRKVRAAGRIMEGFDRDLDRDFAQRLWTEILGRSNRDLAARI